METRSMRRVSELDALRGIAAILVVLYHYTHRFNAKFEMGADVPYFLYFGKYGVNLFFIISGFVIFLTLEKSKNNYDFIVSRFARLFPTYWVCILLTLLTVSVYSLPGWELKLGEVLVNFSMLQWFLKIKAVDGVYWTLAVELNFYFFMYILFLYKGLKKIEKVGLAFLTISCLVNLAHNYFPSVSLFGYLWGITLQHYANLFFAGIIFYQMFNKGVTYKRNLLIVCCLLYDMLIVGWISSLITVFLFFIFYLFVLGRLKRIGNPFLLFFGTISYSWYLLHQNIGYAILHWLNDRGYANSFLFILPLCVSILLAVVVTTVIEKPIAILIKKKYDTLKGRRLALVHKSVKY